VWEAFNYCETFRNRFSTEECDRVIGLHHWQSVVHSLMSNRDSHLFWIPRTVETTWVFARVWDVVMSYNSRYGFELSEQMGQLQLTRYDKGQSYDWHMDLGPGAMSLRKVSVVIELTADGYEGGGIEVFYGAASGRVALDQGDALVFPSFIMHRALPVTSGTRWSLVSWLTGPKVFV
jgi:PKHD-type hydroxylase